MPQASQSPSQTEPGGDCGEGDSMRYSLGERMIALGGVRADRDPFLSISEH
jgi:hypothetical protein